MRDLFTPRQGRCAGISIGMVLRGLTVLPLIITAPALASITFAPPADTVVGSAPQHILAAHMNADTYPDLVVCNSSSNSISVLINDGRGGFSNRTDYSTGPNSSPVRAVVGDFNGDTLNDVAVLHASGGVISVFMSSVVPGVLNPVPTKITLGGTPRGLAAGRLLAGAAPPDLVFVRQDTSVVGVMKNSGHGVFTTGSTFSTSLMPQAVALADLNRDGIPDAITANVAQRNVSILPGKGDRTFLAKTDIPTVHTPGQNILPVMLPGDNFLDIVLPDASHGGLIVLRGNGNGSFRPAEFHPGGAQSYAVGAGDLNNDGLVDIVTANFGSGDVGVFMSNPAGGFDSVSLHRVVPSESTYVNCIAVTDFNQDGLDDVAVTLSNGQVRVLLNTSVFVSALTAAKSSLAAGTATVGTVALTGKAPASGAVIHLSVDDGFDTAVSVPPTVTIPAGKSSVTFDIVARHLGTAKVCATYNGLSMELSLTVTNDTTPPVGLMGDMDGDGQITINDVTMLLRVVGGTAGHVN